MITNFKIFENIDNETTFILNDLIDYYTTDDKKIDTDSLKEFISFLFRWPIVKFYCKHCTDDINGVTHYIHSKKTHKGKVRGGGYGFNEDNSELYFSLKLNRIKYTHEVDTSKPITIYGNINPIYLNIIDEINAKRDSNKYNL